MRQLSNWPDDRINASDPLPADTLFGKAARGDYDGVVAMSHDQGLIPSVGILRHLCEFDGGAADYPHLGRPWNGVMILGQRGRRAWKPAGGRKVAVCFQILSPFIHCPDRKEASSPCQTQALPQQPSLTNR